MPLPGVVPSFTGSWPAASDACEETPAWNEWKSSTEYGLASTNATSATSSAPASRRSERHTESPAPSLTNAASRQSSVIPPVYLVAAASPIPTPAIT